MSEPTELPTSINARTLVEIYLDGFISGAASLATDSGMPAETADVIAASMVDALTGDPIAMEVVRTEVIERCCGITGTARSIEVHTAGGNTP